MAVFFGLVEPKHALSETPVKRKHQLIVPQSLKASKFSSQRLIPKSLLVNKVIDINSTCIP